MSGLIRRYFHGLQNQLRGQQKRRRGRASNASASNDSSSFLARRADAFEDRVLLAGNAPNLLPIAPVSIFQHAESQTVAISGIDAGGSESQPLRVTASSDNTSVIPHPTVVYSSPASSGTLEFTALPGASGAVTITVTVEDGGPDLNFNTIDDNELFTREFGVTVTPFKSFAVNNLFVDARSNLSQAGRSTWLTDGLLPVMIDLPTGQGRWIEMSNVSGSLKAGPQWPTHGADGGSSGPGNTKGTNIFSTDGISGILASRFLFLSGVFLADTTSTAAPSRLDYRNIGMNFHSQSPLLQQTFFIGDGRDASQASQRFFIPDGATRLFLGFMDAVKFGWPTGLAPGAYSDNTGFLAASLSISVPNRLPTLNHIVDVKLPIDAPEQTIELHGITAGAGELQPLQITVVSDNTQLVGQLLLNYIAPQSSGNLVFRPEPGHSGSTTMTVKIEDGGPDGDLLTPLDNAFFQRTFNVTVGSFHSFPVTDLTVDARADLSHASRDTTPDPENRLLPVLVNLPVGTGRCLVVTSVNGDVKAGPEWPIHNADGGMFGPAGEMGANIFAERGISGVLAPRFLFLAGTFLDDETPTVSPSRYDYRYTGTEFANQSPIPQQVFYIGDGQNSDGARPMIKIPDNATRLFLGFMDADTFAWPSGLLPGAYHDNTGQLSVSLSIIVPNAAPTLDKPADLTLTNVESEHTVVLSGISSGLGESQHLRITAASNNTELLADPVVVYTSGDTFGRLILMPRTGFSGSTSVEVQIEDSGPDQNFDTTEDNGTSIQTFKVTVTSQNAPPTLNTIEDLNFDEDAEESHIELTGITAGGGESQHLVVTALSSNKRIVANPLITYSSPDRTALLSIQPQADQSGPVSITVTVEDAGFDQILGTTDDNATFSRTFEIVINSVNDPPTMMALSNRTLPTDSGEQSIPVTNLTAGGGESQPLRLNAISSNPDLIAEFEFDYTSPSDSGSLRFTPTAGLSGTSIITVTIEDGGLDGDLETSNDNATFGHQFEVAVHSPIAGNVDGDIDFDANDSFLIQLVHLSGTDSQIDQSKGAANVAASQIRHRVADITDVGDVDGDGDFDANDAFLIHLVKLSGTNPQIDQSKGSSPLTATLIRANVHRLGQPKIGLNARRVSKTSQALMPYPKMSPWEGPSDQWNFDTGLGFITEESDHDEAILIASVFGKSHRWWLDAI